jgi:hypothetical protein
MDTRCANNLAVALATALAAAPAARADDTMRCRNALITVGMVGTQVVAKCGQPNDRNVTEVPQRGRRNGRSAVIGTLRVERWTYDRGYGRFPALLTFEDGKLKSIELLTSR